jgi:hypothetical protein
LSPLQSHVKGSSTGERLPLVNLYWFQELVVVSVTIVSVMWIFLGPPPLPPLDSLFWHHRRAKNGSMFIYSSVPYLPFTLPSANTLSCLSFTLPSGNIRQQILTALLVVVEIRTIYSLLSSIYPAAISPLPLPSLCSPFGHHR